MDIMCLELVCLLQDSAFSKVVKVKVKVTQPCLTLCDHMDMKFSRPEYWSGQPFHSPGNLSNPGIEPKSPTLWVDFLPAEPQGKPKIVKGPIIGKLPFQLKGNRKNIYAAAAKLLQSCLTLCDPIDGSQPGSPIPGILQARTLEWVAISFSNA